MRFREKGRHLSLLLCSRFIRSFSAKLAALSSSLGYDDVMLPLPLPCAWTVLCLDVVVVLLGAELCPEVALVSGWVAPGKVEALVEGQDESTTEFVSPKSDILDKLIGKANETSIKMNKSHQDGKISNINRLCCCSYPLLRY